MSAWTRIHRLWIKSLWPCSSWRGEFRHFQDRVWRATDQPYANEVARFWWLIESVQQCYILASWRNIAAKFRKCMAFRVRPSPALTCSMHDQLVGVDAFDLSRRSKWLSCSLGLPLSQGLDKFCTWLWATSTWRRAGSFNGRDITLLLGSTCHVEIAPSLDSCFKCTTFGWSWRMTQSSLSFYQACTVTQQISNLATFYCNYGTPESTVSL